MLPEEAEEPLLLSFDMHYGDEPLYYSEPPYWPEPPGDGHEFGGHRAERSPKT